MTRRATRIRYCEFYIHINALQILTYPPTHTDTHRHTHTIPSTKRQYLNKKTVYTFYFKEVERFHTPIWKINQTLLKTTLKQNREEYLHQPRRAHQISGRNVNI